MKKFLRFLYIIVFIFVGIFVFTHPVETQTNILKAVFSNNVNDETIVKLSEKYSSQINIIFEDADEETVEEFVESVDKNSFEFKNYDIQNFLQNSIKFHKNLLSAKTAKKLEEKRYDEVSAEAAERIFDPFNISLVPLNEDPFMLYMDYLQSLGEKSDEFEFNGKDYKILTLNVLPDVSNQDIKELIDLQKNLSNDKTKIYLTGSPVHSYYASTKSMLEINIICALSMLFVIGLCLYYFKNLKLLIPIALSLGIGILSGYFAVSLVFPSIHVLTFVFSTTLIGICIDYSLHYFIEKDLSKIFKSLTVSMVSTVCAFAVLMFSGVEFLKQISIYTMTGLFNVYLIIILFYPLFKFDCTVRKIELKLPNKKIFAVIFALISFTSIFTLKFNDDIRNLYVPSKKLLAAENMFNELSDNKILRSAQNDEQPSNIYKKSKKTFAVVEGKDFEQMLQKEEVIAKSIGKTKFQALSKFIPSEKQQKKNFELRKKLYENSLNKYAEFLTKEDIQKLLNEQAPQKFMEFDNSLGDFLIGKSTSVMILYDFDKPEIIEQNGAKYIDIPNDISAKIKKCRKACLRILLPVFAVLLLLLSILYNFKTAVKILTPSIVASAFSIGLLAVTGQAVNLFHILAIFLIIGFGLDYSVFRAGNHSKEAVLLSCATSVFSFTLLAFTSFKLISSLGFILAVGLAVSYLTSLITGGKYE